MPLFNQTTLVTPSDSLNTDSIVRSQKPRIADLDVRIQQTFFGGQRGPDPVHVDAAPFQHHLLPFVNNGEGAAVQPGANFTGT